MAKILDNSNMVKIRPEEKGRRLERHMIMLMFSPNIGEMIEIDKHKKFIGKRIGRKQWRNKSRIYSCQSNREKICSLKVKGKKQVL